VREDTGQVYTIFVDSAGNTSTGGQAAEKPDVISTRG